MFSIELWKLVCAYILLAAHRCEHVCVWNVNTCVSCYIELWTVICKCLGLHVILRIVYALITCCMKSYRQLYTLIYDDQYAELYTII